MTRHDSAIQMANKQTAELERFDKAVDDLRRTIDKWARMSTTDPKGSEDQPR